MQPILEGTLGRPQARSRYAGLLQILRFNWPWYGAASGCAVSALVLGLALALPGWATIGLGVLAGCAAFWTAASLLAAHYVLDCSPLYAGAWIVGKIPLLPKRWINLHAGLDAFTPLLENLFPGRCRGVFDLYDPRVMSAPSVARARRRSPPAIHAVHAVHAHSSSLSLTDAGCDCVFLFFTAREIREKERRERFFQELKRVLQPGGHLLLAEFVRDGWNTLAFGPGAWHAFAPHEWRRLAQISGFELLDEFPITPFVRVFMLRRPLAC